VHSGKNVIQFVTDRRPAQLMLNPDFDLQEKEYLPNNRKIVVEKIKNIE
jgi:hypothetical protein